MPRQNKKFSLILILLAISTASWASVPDWLRQVAKQSLPAYKPDTNGVVLLDEQITNVDTNGEIYTIYRRAVKILRPNAREELSAVVVRFDNETKLTWLKGWSITASGQEYEVKEKDAVEMSAFASFVQDERKKVLIIPGGEVGSVIGFEYQQRRRPFMYQDMWVFQEDLPVRLSRYSLRLPVGWGYEAFFDNHPRMEPKNSGADLSWEAADVPAIEEEDYMPPHLAVVGRMVLHFFAKRGDQPSSNAASWKSMGAWYADLTRDRRTVSPELRTQIANLTSSSTTTWEKVQALAAWVQKDIRYLDIEIGIGGFQPHYASDVYRNRFGDCKDKATLLSAMFKEIGVDSDFVVIHTVRGLVRPETPSTMTFNHVVLAIQIPADAPKKNLYALYEHPKLGTILFFDPTDDSTPIGELPASLQQSYGLLVYADSGELVRLPLLAPSVNRLMRVGKLKLDADGRLTGEMQEMRTGAIGSSSRARLLSVELSNRAKTIENLLSGNLGSYQLTGAKAGDMNDITRPLILTYTFTAPEYAKRSGPLLLVRPRIVGRKNWTVMETNKRIYPLEFENASLETDTFDIDLPDGYEVDELPDPVNISFDFGEYHSKVQQVGSKLNYSRQYIVKQVWVPTERLDEVKRFFRQIAADERATAVLRKKSTQ